MYWLLLCRKLYNTNVVMQNSLFNKTLIVITLAISIAACSPKVIKDLSITDNQKDTVLIEKVDTVEKYKKPEKIKITFNDVRDSIYDENIHTVLLHKTGWIFSLPIIGINANETLTLSFDDFDPDIKKFKYSIQICDAYWQVLPMQTFQYIDGFSDDYIDDYKLSFNTLQKYNHYNLVFPKENMKITKSGNYLIKIFLEDINQPVIIKRFMVMENLVNIKSKVKDATLLNEKRYRQEIDFSILTHNFIIDNPSRNIIVKIFQNMRADNAIIDLKPRLVKGNELDYDYDEENVFNGGNEFRNFDVKSLKYNSERIKNITYENGSNQVYLHNDLPRPFKVYKSEEDINGKFAIKSDYTKDYETEADYTFVHFSLPFDIPTVEGNIYVYGNFTDWKLSEETRMKYNYKTRAYETSIYVKQGYYNYQYVLKRLNQSVLDETFIEGNHASTENDYFIFVYYRQPGELYDRLIGFQQINSINNRQ